VLSLDPRTLGGVLASVMEVANALGAADRGRALATELSTRIAALADRAQAQPARPRVACIEWIDPLMAAGNWMPELVTLAGGTSVFGAIGAHSPWLEWPALQAADPDVIVVMPCGFGLARTRAELAPLLGREGFGALRAVRERRVCLADGHRFLNRPGPRLVESLQILCEILHPDAFEPAWLGDGWERL
jgi:iron complex transport system substrate-binding protein